MHIYHVEPLSRYGYARIGALAVIMLLLNDMVVSIDQQRDDDKTLAIVFDISLKGTDNGCRNYVGGWGSFFRTFKCSIRGV